VTPPCMSLCPSARNHRGISSSNLSLVGNYFVPILGEHQDKVSYVFCCIHKYPVTSLLRQYWRHQQYDVHILLGLCMIYDQTIWLSFRDVCVSWVEAVFEQPS